MNDFLKIVITTPGYRSNEADEIALMLSDCIDFVHLRKPDWPIAKMERLIEQIPPEFRSRLRLHSHFSLVDKYSLAGAHLNSRWQQYFGHSGSLTRSCHSITEVKTASGMDYVTLSPIFDSISKSGYRAAFDIKTLSTQIASSNVIALGGVTPHQFKSLANFGFAGAAMLGFVWGATSPEELKETLKLIKNASVYN